MNDGIIVASTATATFNAGRVHVDTDQNVVIQDNNDNRIQFEPAELQALFGAFRALNLLKDVPLPSVSARLSDPATGLSPREKDTLEALARTGGTNKILARELGIAEGTIKLHVTSLLRKLGAASRTELVLTAQKKGLLDA